MIETKAQTVERLVLGVLFIAGGVYTGYFGLHPQSNFTLGAAVLLFVLGGIVIDADPVVNALTKLVQAKKDAGI